MKNRETSRAWEYHNDTKHSYLSIRTTPHFLDWANMPRPFKIYPDIEPISLPQLMPATGTPALDAIASEGDAQTGAEPTLGLVASLLYYSAGITKRKDYPGGTIYFRAAACAGALYPVEIYVVCREIEGLAAGVYHFNPGDFALRRLRDGDYRGNLVAASAGEKSISGAPVILVFTAISWRSAWKYRDRAYRYHWWDAGMILANSLALAHGHGIEASVVTGFVEAEANRLVGIDGARELALALLPLGGGDPTPPAARGASELELTTVPLSQSEVDYASIHRMHESSSLTSQSEVSEWRDHAVRFASPDGAGHSGGNSLPLISVTPSELPRDSMEEVVLRRASTRRFARKALPFSELSVVLDQSTDGVASDFLAPGEQLNDLYIIINRVDGVAAGSYFFDRRAKSLEQLQLGDFSDQARYLVLDQELGGDAAATVFFMADLGKLLERYGNRGYRAAQLEAGVIGGRAYLAAYALQRGATGLTFYDDDVTRFFSPHAAAKSCIFVMSFGVPGKKPLY